MIFNMTGSKKNTSSKKKSDIFCHWAHTTFDSTLTDMKKLNKFLLPAICYLLILLWAYAASSKLMDFRMFELEMHRQVLFPFVKKLLAYLLPSAEIIIVFLLLFKSSYITGLYLSLIMLLAFTIYTGLAVVNAFGEIPCSCGGILNKMGWRSHFIFNIIFLLLTAFGIYLYNGERRQINQQST